MLLFCRLRCWFCLIRYWMVLLRCVNVKVVSCWWLLVSVWMVLNVLLLKCIF